MNIRAFKKGDLITRIEPMCYLDTTSGGSFSDDKYIGLCMTFHGMANGMIYCTKWDDDKEQYQLIDLPIHKWDEGWEYWVDPFKLIDENQDVIRTSLNTQLTKALADEDYMEASRLRDEIAGKKKSNKSKQTKRLKE